MKPKEKAEQLVLKYSNLINYDFVSDLKFNNPNDEDRNRRVKKDAKKCAILAVDEMIHYLEIILGVDKEDFEYWQEVKQEIENL